METTSPPHEEVLVIDGSLLPVDDVARNQDQFMDSISPSLVTPVDHQQPPPVDEIRQPEISGSPIEEVEYKHHQKELLNSVSPPENSVSVDCQIPPPGDKISDVQQPPSPPLPPLTEPEYPPENHNPNNESPLSKQPPLPSLSPSPLAATEAEYQPENLSPPLLKQPQSPSLSAAEADYPPENLSPKHETPLSRSPSPTEADESTLLKPPPSPSPIGAEEPLESPKLKQSPPHDTLEPNTRTPPLGVPLLLHAAATFSQSKPQISTWTHQETANLIQAYQEKWYSLKKGPLKAGQWEEVAITVAARCGYDEPTKTSKQCRHKIEKLRKRYRTERGKPRSKATAWNFFKLMDNLEKGPLPISSSQPMELVEYQKPSTSNGKKRKNDVYDDSEFLANKRSSTSRARNSDHYVANGGLATNLRFSEGGNRIVRGLRTPVIHKRKEVYQEEREEENNENVCEEEENVAGQLAAEIKGFAEKFVKMEKNKIEMMRDVERYRLEMENKRMEMIIESQQMLVETVNNAFGSSVKTHRLSAS